MNDPPRLVLCTLLLNEQEWLAKLVSQHRDWPGLIAWVFVEAADVVYAEANPDLVSPAGLSVDGTSEFLEQLAATDPRVVYVPHGFCSAANPAEGKGQARQRYLDVMEDVRPDWFLVLDADEFYRRDHQTAINRLAETAFTGNYDSLCLPYRHLWRPASLADRKLCTYEVVGGFWQIPHCHGFRWLSGLRYDTFHMTPDTPQKMPLTRRMLKVSYSSGSGHPACVHTAFASAVAGRRAKHRYYAARGEDADPRRAWYVRSRRLFEDWQPGDALPRGARVIDYTGPVPEVLADL